MRVQLDDPRTAAGPKRLVRLHGHATGYERTPPPAIRSQHRIGFVVTPDAPGVADYKVEA